MGFRVSSAPSLEPPDASYSSSDDELCGTVLLSSMVFHIISKSGNCWVINT